MTQPSHASSRTARRTGAAYLGVVVAGIFAEFFVRGSLVVDGDAQATAVNLAGAPAFFSLSIVGDMAMVALDVAVAFGLYRLLRGVHRRLAIAATGLRLLQASVLAINLLNLVRALELASAASGDAAMADATLAAMEAHALVYDLGLVAFGLACITLGRLLRLALAPRALAWGLTTTGLVYLVGSFGALFLPALGAALDPLYAIAIVVEPAFAIWLIARGGRLARAHGAGNEVGAAHQGRAVWGLAPTQRN